jgi:Uncharacterised nucleotidyltransferase
MTTNLRAYWPGLQSNQLLKGAFHSDMGIAAQAWRSWLETCDFDNTLWGDLRIASLAHRRFGGSEVAGVLAPRLQGLRRYIWSAGQMKIEAARPLLKEFTNRNVVFMPIKGSVRLGRDPQAMGDRFISDVDVLIDHASWENAANIALSQGWSSKWGLERNVAFRRMRQTHHALDLERGPHGAVDLHQFSLLLNRQLGADVTLWKRASSGTLSGIPVMLPHPSDQLAIIFGHCFIFTEHARSLDWVADALATISTPGFDWCLFTDAILDRELAVPAATALTYLAEELQCSIPSAVTRRIAGQVREPFLSEFAAYYRTWEFKDAEECRAICQAECIRSRHFIQRVPSSSKVVSRKRLVNVTLPEIKAGQKVVLPIPPGVRPTDRVQFRLLLEVADEWRKGSSRVLGTSAIVRLRNVDGDVFPLELGRWVVRRKQGQPQELRGEIDGSLVVGRGIDEVWLYVTTVKAFWLYNLRARVVRFGTKGAREAVWLRKLRRVRALTLGFDSNGTRGANGGTVSQGAIVRGRFEANILSSHS